MPLELLAAPLLLVGIALLIAGWKARAQLPHGRLVYLDATELKRVPKTLYDDEYDLAGRPDFIIRNRAGTIPVEAKSSRKPPQPHRGHLLQLAAYCRLVEAAYGRRPPYAILRYRDGSFRIGNTPALQRALHTSLQRMRTLASATPDRSHQQPARCRACAYRQACDQVL